MEEYMEEYWYMDGELLQRRGFYSENLHALVEYKFDIN